MKAPGALAVLGATFAMLLAYASDRVGLAAIVGAFAAGLMLAPARAATRLFEEVRPVAALFAPIFFVTLGMRLDVAALQGHAWQVLAIGASLGVAATLAKLA